MRRLLLVRHAPTSATRSLVLPADEALDERGIASAAVLRDLLPAHVDALCSPALRCRQTASGAGLDAPRVDAALAECDFGAWSGRTLAEIDEAQPQDLRAWMIDPQARPHGGESLQQLSTRVGRWLSAQVVLDGTAVAITHGGVVKTAVVHALCAPLETFWRVAADPLSITELHGFDGQWTLAHSNRPALA